MMFWMNDFKEREGCISLMTRLQGTMSMFSVLGERLWSGEMKGIVRRLM